MGGCWSASPQHILVDGAVDGDLQDYQSRYLEDQILGEGEFGQVKLVYDTAATGKGGGSSSDDPNAAVAKPLACKILRKGIQFKDNILYSPIKPEVLQSEVNILRKLDGRNYNLRLIAVYESSRYIHVITEYCGGGEMMEYVGRQKQDLRTEDVSRIAYQFLSAVAHCQSHRILHRDIKPENVMFVDPAPNAPLRLIDFGSGRFHKKSPNTQSKSSMNTTTTTTTTTASSLSSSPSEQSGTNSDYHATFAGTAFYMSPEMFDRRYTFKTDVWSAGVTLYVLVAGFPSDDLQKMFNLLHTSGKHRNLRKLQNIPSDMPDSYFELLDRLLTYREKSRPSAADVLDLEFVQFHKNLEDGQVGLSLEDISGAAHRGGDHEGGTTTTSSPRNNTLSRTTSIRLTGSVGRHAMMMGFRGFERGLTMILATMLTGDEVNQFIQFAQERINRIQENNRNNSQPLQENNNSDDNGFVKSEEQPITSSIANNTSDDGENKTTAEKLQVIRVSEVKEIIQSQPFEKENVIQAIEKLNNERLFQSFAYHMEMLIELCRGESVVREDTGQMEWSLSRTRNSIVRNASFSNLSRRQGRGSRGGGGGGSIWGTNGSGSNKWNFNPNNNSLNGTNNSVQSATFFSPRLGHNNSNNGSKQGNTKGRSNSVHGSNVYGMNLAKKVVSHRRKQKAAAAAVTQSLKVVATATNSPNQPAVIRPIGAAVPPVQDTGTSEC